MEKNTHHNIISISELYHQTVQLYTKQFFNLAGINIITQLITVLLGLGVGVTLLSSALNEELLKIISLNNRFSLTTILLVILMLLVQVFRFISTGISISDNQKRSLFAIFKAAVPFLLRGIGFSFVFLAVGILGMLLAFPVLLILSTALGAFSQDLFKEWYDYLGYTLGLGSAVLSTYVIFAGYSILEKNSTLKEGLRHSVFLVRGHFWPVAIRLLLGYGVMLTLVYIIEFIPWLSSLFIWITYVPLMAIYVYILYTDLSSRKNPNRT